jgi:hypothetical protein
VAAVALLWTTVIVGMGRTGLGFPDDRPISYLGADPRTVALFRTGLLVATFLLAGFGWFVTRRFASPRSFLVVLLIGLAGQAVVAVVPISGHGVAHAVHTVAGLVLGLSLPLLMWRFAAGLRRGSRRSLSYALFWLEVAASVVGIVLSRASRATIAEVVPAVVFHLWVFVVTVLARALTPPATTWSGSAGGGSRLGADLTRRP